MRRRLAVTAAVLAAAAPALADERDERIEKLEREVAELKAMRGLPVDVSAVRAAVDDYLARSASSSSSGMYAGPGGVLRPRGDVSFGGYFSTRYLASQAGGRPSFVDMRLVPQIHAQITDRIAFDSEIEFEHGGVGGPAPGEIVVEFAELSFRSSDAFKFKVGTLLVPFGWFNQNHDDPLNELSSRPDVARYVIPSAFDNPGIGAEGSVELDDDTALAYDVVLSNGLSDSFDGDSGSRGARGLFEEDDNHDKTVFARAAVIPTLDFLDAFTFGVSGMLGAVGAQDDRINGFGFDAAAKEGPWEFKGEYSQLGIQRDGALAPPRSPSGVLGPVRGLHGWYAQILHRFTDPWVRSLPFAEKDASVGLVLRRDSVDLNDRVHGAGARDDERAFSFGVNYRPTSKTVVKFEFRTGSSGAPGDVGQERDLFVVEFATYF